MLLSGGWRILLLVASRVVLLWVAVLIIMFSMGMGVRAAVMMAMVVSIAWVLRLVLIVWLIEEMLNGLIELDFIDASIRIVVDVIEEVERLLLIDYSWLVQFYKDVI
jgi:hypothetical protein